MLFGFWKWRRELRGAELQLINLAGEKKKAQVELATMTEQVKNAMSEAQRKLADNEAQFKREYQETIGLLKLRSEQEQAKLKLHYDTELAQLRASQVEELANVKANAATKIAERESTLAKEYYSTLKGALVDITKDGSAQAEFMQALALKMFEKPSLPAIQQIDVKTTNKSE